MLLNGHINMEADIPTTNLPLYIVREVEGKNPISVVINEDLVINKPEETKGEIINPGYYTFYFRRRCPCPVCPLSAGTGCLPCPRRRLCRYGPGLRSHGSAGCLPHRHGRGPRRRCLPRPLHPPPGRHRAGLLILLRPPKARAKPALASFSRQIVVCRAVA